MVANGVAAGHWTDVYSRKGEADVSWYQPVPARSLALIRRFNPDPDGAIVDVGGGASRLVDNLLDAGYRNVTVMDLASPALEQARQRLAERAEAVDWQVGDVTAWQPPQRYRLWHDRAMLHFLVDPRDRAAYRAALANALEAGGYAVIATFAPDGPAKCSGLAVQRYDENALAGVLGPGFRLVHSEREIHETPGRKNQAFGYHVFRYGPEGA